MVVTLGRCYQHPGVEVRDATNPAMLKTALPGDSVPTGDSQDAGQPARLHEGRRRWDCSRSYGHLVARTR